MIHFIIDNVMINCVFLKMNLFALECTEANISTVSFFWRGRGGIVNTEMKKVQKNKKVRYFF